MYKSAVRGDTNDRNVVCSIYSSCQVTNLHDELIARFALPLLIDTLMVVRECNALAATMICKIVFVFRGT